jgi:hypothetical protein
MSFALQKGQRVRITVRNRTAGYQPRDKGTVLDCIQESLSGV